MPPKDPNLQCSTCGAARVARNLVAYDKPFYFKNLCFINQIKAGDEWLVIRDGIAFESLTAGAMEYPEFRDWIKCVMNATEEDLRNLTY